MKKLLILIFVLSLFVTQLASADLFFGQTHYHSVFFRGNGEAIVFSKLILTNSDDKPISELSFQIPDARTSELIALQQKFQSPCLQYDATKPNYPCIQYETPSRSDYLYPNYPNSPSEYKKLKYEQSGNHFRVTLADQIKPNESGVVLVAYSAMGYVTESLGLYKFNFKTLQVPARVQLSQVAVDVDADLIMRGGKASVDYALKDLQSIRMGAAGSSFSSPEVDRISANIGYYGQLLKSTQNLAPNESFVVRGEYAKSNFRLYLASVLWGILIVVLVLLAVVGVIKFFRRKFATSPNIGHEMVNIVTIGTGLLSAVLVLLVTVFIRVVIQYTERSFYYGRDPILILVVLVLAIMLYAFAVFGPGVLVGLRFGWKAFFVVLVSEFFWLVLLLILYLLLMQPNRNIYNGPVPLPLGVEGVEPPVNK